MPSSINTVYFVDGIFVDYVGNPLPLGIAGGAGATGPTGPTGDDGLGATGFTSISLYQARKYVKEFWPPGATLLRITRQEILDSTIMGPIPGSQQPNPPFGGATLPYGMYFGPDSPAPDSIFPSVTDIHVQLWYRNAVGGGTAWTQAPTDDTATGGGISATNKVLVDNASGDIIIDYRYPAGTNNIIRAVVII